MTMTVPRILTAIAATVIGLAMALPSPAAGPEWIVQLGTGRIDRAAGVAVDADDNLIIAATTDGWLGRRKGSSDGAVIKMDAQGYELWRRQLGSVSMEVAYALALDANDGSILVAGDTAGALPGPHKGYTDGFVIKLGADGRHVWKRQPGTNEYDSIRSVACSSDGSVAVGGFTDGKLGTIDRPFSDGFVIRYDRDGRWLWRRQPGSDGSREMVNAVAFDADGNVYAAGHTSGWLAAPNAGGFSDAFLIKYDAGGRRLWARQFGTGQSDSARGIAFDGNGSVYLVGETWGWLAGPNRSHMADPFVVKLDADGNELWRRQPGSARTDVPTGVAVSGNGDVHVAGYTLGDVGGPNQGRMDAFVLTLDHDGQLLGAHQFGTPDDDSAQGIAVGTGGDLLMVGETWGSLAAPNQGSSDLFFARFAPLPGPAVQAARP